MIAVSAVGFCLLGIVGVLVMLVCGRAVAPSMQFAVYFLLALSLACGGSLLHRTFFSETKNAGSDRATEVLTIKSGVKYGIVR